MGKGRGIMGLSKKKKKKKGGGDSWGLEAKKGLPGGSG